MSSNILHCQFTWQAIHSNFLFWHSLAFRQTTNCTNVRCLRDCSRLIFQQYFYAISIGCMKILLPFHPNNFTMVSLYLRTVSKIDRLRLGPPVLAFLPYAFGIRTDEIRPMVMAAVDSATTKKWSSLREQYYQHSPIRFRSDLMRLSVSA